MNNDLISREALKKAFLNHSCTEFEIKNMCRTDEHVIALIDNAPEVDTSDADAYETGYLQGYERGKNERSQGKCKNCKYYNPYYEQFTNKPRGDGYCVIARMTPEGMTTINCNDEFGCSDYQKGGAE